MYYKELLRVSRGLAIYAAIFAILAVIGIAVQSSGNFVIETGPVPGGSVAVHHATPGTHIPFAAILAIAAVTSAIFASIVGISLSTENDDHLEVAWTLPVSRLHYALLVMAIDVSAILLAFGVTFLASLAVISAHGLARNLFFESDTWLQLMRFLIYPLAWFGVAQALTASMRCKAGAYAGFAWAVAFILIALYEAPLNHTWHAIFTVVNYINPVRYASYAAGSGVSSQILDLNLAVAISGLSAIAVFGIALALLQWRRLEA